MKEVYCVEKVGRGLEGGYHDTLAAAVVELNNAVSDLLSQGWYQIHHEGEGRHLFVVLAKDGDGGKQLRGYQIKSVSYVEG